MSIRKVGVIGRGAVGVLFGGLLNDKLGKSQVGFLADEARTNRYKENPIYCNGELCDFTYTSNPEEFGTVDLLLIAVKYPVLRESLQSVRGFVTDQTIILTLLNGITSEGIVEEELQKGIVIHSIAQLMDSVKSGNQVAYTKTGEIVIGTPDKEKQPQLACLAEFFDETGMPYHIAADVIHEQWSKLMLNCGLNQICAVYDVPYSGCQRGGAYEAMFRNTMEEVRQIACLEGIAIGPEEIDGWLKAIDGLAPDAMPSMRQDVLAGNVTEVDLFSRTMMDLGKKHGVEVPLNAFLYEKIKEKEREMIKKS